jgi:hypothetical protein
MVQKYSAEIEQVYSDSANDTREQTLQDVLAGAISC